MTVALRSWDLEGSPDEPFEYAGTPRGVFHQRLARLVEDALRSPNRPMPMGLQRSHLEGVAVFNSPGWTMNTIDVLDIRCSNARHALRRDGDVVYINMHGEDAIEGDHASSDELFDLLAEIPTDTDLHELDADGFSATFGSDSLIRRIIGRLSTHGIDQPASVVLLARKRPRLVPVDDRLVGTILGLRLDEDPLCHWWWALHHDTGLVADLRRLQPAWEDSSELSLLRTAEAVVLRSAAPTVTDDGTH